MAPEVAASALCGVTVLARKNGNGVVGAGPMLHGEPHTRTHLAGGATANGVDDHHGRAWLSERRIHVLGAAGFAHAGPG